MKPLPIDIWSDIACPWCWVGKRRLEAALERFEHRDAVKVIWHAFELDPGAPKQVSSEVDYVERLARKYGTDRGGAQRMIDTMTKAAAEDGLTMRFDHIQPGNTFDAHRLVHFAKGVDKQDAMKERLLCAYLEEGALMSDWGTLARLGAEIGLDEGDVTEMLAGDAFADEVRDEERAAGQLGIHGVPFFIVGGRLAFSGAQPRETILQVLERAWAEREDEDEAEDRADEMAEGSACTPAGCD